MGQLNETNKVKDQLSNEHQLHDATKAALKPFLVLEEQQDANKPVYVRVSVTSMAFREFEHNDVPTLSVEFYIENYLRHDIEFDNPENVNCDVFNDARTGNVNTASLIVGSDYRNPIPRLAGTTVWMHFRISEPTRDHLVENIGEEQGWTFRPTWMFRRVGETRGFHPTIRNRKYIGLVSTN